MGGMDLRQLLNDVADSFVRLLQVVVNLMAQGLLIVQPLIKRLFQLDLVGPRYIVHVQFRVDLLLVLIALCFLFRLLLLLLLELHRLGLRFPLLLPTFELSDSVVRFV